MFKDLGYKPLQIPDFHAMCLLSYLQDRWAVGGGRAQLFWQLVVQSLEFVFPVCGPQILRTCRCTCFADAVFGLNCFALFVCRCFGSLCCRVIADCLASFVASIREKPARNERSPLGFGVSDVGTVAPSL